jgi:hypothetical protein
MTKVTRGCKRRCLVENFLYDIYDDNPEARPANQDQLILMGLKKYAHR